MEKLKGFQAKHLRGLAHSLKPVVFIGQKGITDDLIKSADDALEKHELIKVKFIDYKDKAQKLEITKEIENRTGCRMAGMIGHIAILYRQHPDPEKRKILIAQG